MTFEIFKMIVNTLKEQNVPKAHVGFTKRDDGLFSAVMCGIVMSSTKGSEYLNVNWGDGHFSRVKVLEVRRRYGI